MAATKRGAPRRRPAVTYILKFSLRTRIAGQNSVTYVIENCLSAAICDEGGFASQLGSAEGALDAISRRAHRAGDKLGERILIALDPSCLRILRPPKQRLRLQEIR